MTQPPAEDCLLFDGYLDSKGYGIKWFKDRKKQLRVHRVVLEEKIGRPIAGGMQANHTCDTPSCVNPDHLWEGTQAENIRDMDHKGRRVYTNPHLDKTHCPGGHPYSGENLYVAKDGSRHCKTCKRASVRKYFKEKRGIGRGA